MKNNFLATAMVSSIAIASPALAQLSASSVLQYIPLVLAFSALLWGVALVSQHKDMRGSYQLLVLSAGIVCLLPLFFTSLSSEILVTSLTLDVLVALGLRSLEIKAGAD
jgi:hypothetical protein